MSETVVRPYEDRDREAFFRVRSLTFEGGRPIPPERQALKTTSGFLAEVGGEVAGVFVVLDLTATRGPAVLRCAGIAGVAVLPHYRRSGVGAAMMRWALVEMRNQGYHLASLYAFRESYYRSFGYEVCGGRWRIDVPNHRYPKVDSHLQVRTLTGADYELLAPAYEAFARARNGMNLRTKMHWDRVIGESATVYAAGDPVEAYAVVNHSSDFWQEQTVAELVWSTRAGYETILDVLGGIGINKTGMSWYEPADSPFLADYVDQGVSAKFERPIMYRVLDVPRSLEALVPADEGEFTMAVDDTQLPGNGGPWRIQFKPGQTCVSPASEAGMRLDIRHFTQALLGQPSLLDQLRNGLVDQASDSIAASRLLTPAPVYCTEFF